MKRLPAPFQPILKIVFDICNSLYVLGTYYLWCYFTAVKINLYLLRSDMTIECGVGRTPLLVMRNQALARPVVGYPPWVV